MSDWPEMPPEIADMLNSAIRVLKIQAMDAEDVVLTVFNLGRICGQRSGRTEQLERDAAIR